MISNIKNWVLFHLLVLRVCILRVKYEIKNKSEPKILYLCEDKFQLFTVALYHLELFDANDFAHIFGVNHIGKDSGIKFARYE